MQMFKLILASSLLLASFLTYSNAEIVQGPFEIRQNAKVYLQKENYDDYPLALYFLKDNKSIKIDTYETEGDEPSVETVFFMTIHNKTNVIVLISWAQLHRAENIKGKLFKAYAYIYDNNNLTVNNKINNDPNLSGEEGEFGGEQLYFKYQNAEKIKKYILGKY